MKCAVCGADGDAALLHLGAYCCEEHGRELLRRHHALLDELRREELLVMPEALGVPEFERFVLKFAVRLVEGMSQPVRLLYLRQAPLLLNPLEMASELKARTLPHLPAEYVELEEATGWARLFRDGTYGFKQPVPSGLVLEAMARAGILPDQG
jgi:hypothetical protein